jgi:hypothetical protein
MYGRGTLPLARRFVGNVDVLSVSGQGHVRVFESRGTLFVDRDKELGHARKRL